MLKKGGTLGRANGEPRHEKPRRGGVLGEGVRSSPFPPARESGERCKLPSGVRGRAQTQVDFCTVFEL